MTDTDLKVALQEQLTVPIWPHVGKALGLSRNATYEAARRGDFPSLRIGGAIRVPTAALRKMLGMEPSPSAGSVEKRVA